eukprot:COSAG01_NODE_21301_length_908_cov_1.714462_2_plen_40_part_01
MLCSRDDNMLTVIEFILVGGGAPTTPPELHRPPAVLIVGP